MKPVFTYLALVMIVLLAANSCSPSRQETSQIQNSVLTKQQSLSPEITAIIRSLGMTPARSLQKAPSFATTLLDGTPDSLSSHSGSWVLLNFWATWCPPCRAEMPGMDAVYKQLAAKGLVLLAVNLQEDKATVDAFIKRYKYSFPILMDENGAIGSLYAIRAIPTTYLVAPDGTVAGTLVGTQEWNTPEIIAALEALLAANKP